MIFLGFMIITTVMFAQRKTDPMERAAIQAEKMKSELGLDDVQIKAVKAINEEFSAKYRQAFGDSTMSREERHKKMRTLHEEKDAALKKVLNDDQYKKMLANRSNAKEHSARMAKYRGDHANRMKESLSLSDEQFQKIKAMDKEFGDKFRTIRTDSTLSRDDLRSKVKQLRSEYNSRMKSVLTEEQFQKWEKQKQERRKKRS
jgi:hypothetical protein